MENNLRAPRFGFSMAASWTAICGGLSNAVRLFHNLVVLLEVLQLIALFEKQLKLSFQKLFRKGALGFAGSDLGTHEAQ